MFGRQIQTAETRTLVMLSVAAMFGTALLDMIEDHHILAMLYGVAAGTLYAAPVAMLPIGNFGRWLGFVAGFALIIPLACRRAAGAAATDVSA